MNLNDQKPPQMHSVPSADKKNLSNGAPKKISNFNQGIDIELVGKSQPTNMTNMTNLSTN